MKTLHFYSEIDYAWGKNTNIS